MQTHAASWREAPVYPVQLLITPSVGDRRRLTVAFRLILAIPHLILIGAPTAAMLTWGQTPDQGRDGSSGAGLGVLGVVAVVAALIAWVAIVFTGRSPAGLTSLAAFYMRWRVHVAAYVALLRDEYPAFGEAPYPIDIDIAPLAERDRLSVAFRPILAIPQVLCVWAIGIAWALATCVAWFAILFTGRYPAALVSFSTGALRWTMRVEAYLLLLTDEYPPFSLD